MRLFFILLSILLITSCASRRAATKLYGKCKKNYFACTQIEINQDNTFEYFVFMDVGGQTLRKGTWSKHKGDTILLNTYKQPKNKTTSYKGTINPNLKNKVRISIRDFEQKLGFSSVEINDGAMIKLTDENGIVEFETDKITNITYYYIGEISEKITISNPNVNDIDILIRDLDLNIIPNYFTNLPIVVTNRKVIFYPNHHKKRFEQKRTSTKRKQWE